MKPWVDGALHRRAIILQCAALICHVQRKWCVRSGACRKACRAFPFALSRMPAFAVAEQCVQMVERDRERQGAAIAAHDEQKVADAYQIVSWLLNRCDLFNTADGERVLDYFSGKPIEGDILPWPREPEPEPHHDPEQRHGADELLAAARESLVEWEKLMAAFHRAKPAGWVEQVHITRLRAAIARASA